MSEEIKSERPPCPKCQSDNIQRTGKNASGSQRYRCVSCKFTFTDQEDRGPDPVAPTGDGVLAAAYWVASNMTLKGERMRVAKRKASGLALSMLDAVNTDPAFKRTFLNTMIPKLFLNEKKMEEEAITKRETKILVDQIDKMLTTALKESNRRMTV